MKRLIYLSLAFLVSSATEIYSQSLQEYKLTPDQGGDIERFGSTISIDGNYVCIGVPEYNEYKGTAYIFEWDGASWAKVQQINPSDGVEGDEFGYSVSINGEYAIVGARMERTSPPGAAYIFKKNGTEWIEKQKLVPSDGQNHDEFGYSVALTNNFAMIGSGLRFTALGSVYIFHNENEVWSETQKIISPDNESFGEVLVANDDWLFVSGPTNNSRLKGSVYAYKFVQTEWTIKDTITVEDGVEGDELGSKMSYDGESLLVGFDYRSGLYVFGSDGDKWVQTSKIDENVAAIAINLPLIALGYTRWSQGGYVSIYNDMILTRTVYASDSFSGNEFGYALAMSDEFLVVGAPGAHAAYVYHMDELTGLESRREISAMKYKLLQNYPNPFNPTTKISYSLSKSENVKITVYNTIGQSIETLLNKKMSAGFHEITYNAYNLSSGIYYYRIKAGDFQDMRKMILIK